MASSRPVYLDYQSTSPCDPRVVAALTPYFTGVFGNPSNPDHAFGREARDAVERARGQVAALIGAAPEEIVFTSGTTESNHLAVVGAAVANAAKGRHVVAAKTEHKALLGPLSILRGQGFEIGWVPVDSAGRVDPADVRRALRPDTVLVSLMHANNEIGTIHPIAEIGRIARTAGVLFHTDAAQTAGHEPIDVSEIPADLVSFSAHKMYGPKGAGALFLRRQAPRLKVSPVMLGGGQERGLRPSTLSVPAIVGFGEACAIARDEMRVVEAEVRIFRDAFRAKLARDLPDWEVNGPADGRLGNNLNLWVRGIGSARDLLARLPSVAASTGSSCDAANVEPSHVLTAIGLAEDAALASFRFGFGKFLSMDDVHRAADAFVDAVEAARAKR